MAAGSGEQRGADRRSPYGEILFRQVSGAGDGTVSFDDFVRAAVGSGARVSHVVEWLTQATASGVLEEVGYAADATGRPTGPRLFRLGPAGVAAVERDRRRAERRRGA
jgi:hypothetical protein